MRHRCVSDLMTTSVVRVRRSATFKDVARLIAENDITALPVVDAQDHPLGVVSEHDLMAKSAAQAEPGGHLLAADLQPADRAKATAATAGDLMTSPPVVARPQWSVVEAARAMEQHHVKRLPVVDDTDRLVGIISRHDLLRVFLRRDRAIREEIQEDILLHTLDIAPGAVRVTVDAGRVALDGTVERRSLVAVAERLCRAVDGVISVDAHLTWEQDDLEEPPAAP
ncbi:CBS domain-containing protein [Streptomyces sp. DSM 44917]|uniref:CBS domain-containing protein n=1 Tax=Streptomyces boetiae TaxID=3075541 RepID=A0ABU2L7H4_9ACTN|nr:CBS domain-containing protein [Streptomyces sp. DSM 44917]MDT0307516.1 CBS domain-containing protein [Streptomyces sp. DSM 44917]